MGLKIIPKIKEPSQDYTHNNTMGFKTHNSCHGSCGHYHRLESTVVYQSKFNAYAWSPRLHNHSQPNKSKGTPQHKITGCVSLLLNPNSPPQTLSSQHFDSSSSASLKCPFYSFQICLFQGSFSLPQPCASTVPLHTNTTSFIGS